MDSLITAERYHDISCGHRVVGHENKCKHLHGHNYRITFVIAARQLDYLGRVMDFGVIKTRLCEWLENNLDHKLIIWELDPFLPALKELDPKGLAIVPFNPTAEALAKYICEEVAPEELTGTNCILIECRVEETRKCAATYKLRIK